MARGRAYPDVRPGAPRLPGRDRPRGVPMSEVVNFGCRLNIFEGEVIRGHLAAAETADTVVVNSCAVPAEAVRHARQAVRRLKRERPAEAHVVTGCAAPVETE